MIGALNGVAETGATIDAGLVRPFLAHPRARVRRAALRALCRLAPEQELLPFESALLDDTPSAGAEAVRCLRRRTGHCDPARLWARATRRPPRVRVLLFRVFRSLAKWRHLELLLSGAIDPEAGVRDVALRELEAWLARFNRSFVVLAEADRTTLQALLGKAGTMVPAPVRRELEFVVRVT